MSARVPGAGGGQVLYYSQGCLVETAGPVAEIALGVSFGSCIVPFLDGGQKCWDSQECGGQRDV